jgi:uncharacterized membrane protein YvbJ
MGLINCSECGTQVSSMAAACPKCGNPVANRADAEAAGTQITTTQQTAKKFKAHMLIGLAFCVGGVIMILTRTEYSPLGSIAFVIGLIWFIVARARAWWSNG